MVTPRRCSLEQRDRSKEEWCWTEMKAYLLVADKSKTSQQLMRDNFVA
jgi:hypothetical protein